DLYNWVLSGCSIVSLLAYLSRLYTQESLFLDSKLAIAVSSTNHLHQMPLHSTSSFSTESTTFDCLTPTRFPSTNEEM
ncbi:hypothetical protein BDN72DRAFT_851569, partial [Pluteus cervinus]